MHIRKNNFYSKLHPTGIGGEVWCTEGQAADGGSHSPTWGDWVEVDEWTGTTETTHATETGGEETQTWRSVGQKSPRATPYRYFSK